jgi:hypothetical protein
VRYQFHSGDDQKAGADPKAIAFDKSGNVYLTGFIQTRKTDVDFLTVKYSPTGRMLWERRYNGTGNDVDRAFSMAVGADGSAVVTGDSLGKHGNGTTRLSECDIVTVKYAPDGTKLWERRYNGEFDGQEYPIKALLDNRGNIVVVGWSFGRGGIRNGWQRGTREPTKDVVAIKYGPGGKRLWAWRGSDGSRMGVHPNDAAMDRDGNVYVACVSGSSAQGPPGSDFLTLKITAGGKRAWMARSVAGIPRVIGLDRAGHIYTVGEGRAPGTPDADRTGCIVVKYSPSGRKELVSASSEDNSRITQVSAARVLPDGSVAAVGLTGGSNVARLVMRSPTGKSLWWRTFEETVPYERAAFCTTPNRLYLGTRSHGERKPGEKRERSALYCYDVAGRLIWRAADADLPLNDNYTDVLASDGRSVIFTYKSGNVVTFKFQP